MSCVRVGKQQEEDAAALGMAVGVLRDCGFPMGQRVNLIEG